MNKKAFTLLELLVVIVIIGIIAALLAPAVGKARQGAKKSQCANNLREIGIAVHLYIDDHDYKFPRTDTGGTSPYWFDYLLAYIDDNNVMKCPSYDDHVTRSPLAQSYAYNEYLSMVDINDVLSSSYCMIATDSRITGKQVITTAYGGYGLRITTTHYISYTEIPGDRHSHGTNVLFVDGHVSWYRTSFITNLSGADKTRWYNN